MMPAACTLTGTILRLCLLLALAACGESVALMERTLRAFRGTSRSAVTPVEKVTELLVKLRSQVQEEGKAEAVGYDKYACFCKEQADDKVSALKKADVQIEALQAAVTALGGEIDQLSLELVGLRAEVGTEEGAAQTAVSEQQGRSTSYHAERQNLTEGIDAIDNALESLRSSRDSMSQAKVGAALAQVRALSVESATLEALQEPNAYEYRSKDILATLQSLHMTFKQQVATLDEEYAAETHQHNMVEGARANKIAAAEHSIDKKEKLSAEKTAEKSTKAGLLSQEATARAADQAFLDELTSGCTAKAQAWDERSTTRAQEITKLTEAMAALEQVGGLYSVNKRLTGLVLKGRKTAKAGALSKPIASFLQLAAAPTATGPAKQAMPQQLVDFLEQRAQALKSSSLAQLVAAARLSDDPFVRVRSLINDLIAKLEAQAGEEMSHKNFCDQEMSSAVGRRDERQAEIEGLEASIEATNAAIKEHEALISELATEIADLHKALLEITTLRSEEQAQNSRTVADADAGKDGVDQAIATLQSFYASSGEALAFVQLHAAKFVPANADRHGNTVSDLAPETFTGTYDGKLAQSEGVVGLLQVIASDFERTSTETSAAEVAAESAFQQQKTSLETSIGNKEGSKSSEGIAKGDKETSLVGFQDSLKTANDLHATAISELETLKASCIDAAESYEMRREQRQKEIEALKEAKRILEEWQS